MPRAIVTPELAETLRSIRLKNKIQAKNLAAHIKKSPAFISKLENGNIQTIDTKELYDVLQFISGENDSAELAEQIYASLKFKYSSKEIEEQLWFTNYDTVECLLPIPEALVDDMVIRLERLGVSRSYLNMRINANEALPPEDRNNDSIEVNQWYHQNRIGGDAQSIKIKLTERQMNAILNKEVDVAPYVFVFCVLFYILKIEKYGYTIDLPDDKNSELMRMTTDILNSHKFLSISEKNNLLAEKESQEEISEMLSSFDNANIEILGDIISGFGFASNHNIKTTNEQLQAFRQNMHWDLGFMLRVISLNFKSMEKASFSNKKALLLEIEDLISKYAQASEMYNIEEY